MATYLDDGGFVFKTPAGVATAQQVVTREHEIHRFERIALNWNFYLGKHWTFQREDDEPLVTLNYLKRFLDKKVEFLIGADFTLTVPPSLESVTLPKLQQVWANNGRQSLNYEVAQQGSVTGDVFLLVTVDKPDPIALKFDPFAQQRIVIQRLNSHECHPVWDETSPPGKYGRRLLAFTVIKFITRWNIAEQEDEEIQYRLTITDNWYEEQLGEDPPVRRGNDLGEIPVVHIKNLPFSGSNFGLDDCTDLISINKDINEKSTDVSDSINYNASPITVIIGARAKNLERSPRAIWAIPTQGATVSHLKLEGDLAASVSYLERQKQAMHDISAVPKAAFGDPQHISGTSGVALAMTLQPLIDERNRKRSTYEPGYERVNYFVLRYAEMYHDLRLPQGLCEKCGGKIALFYVPHPETIDLPDQDPRKKLPLQIRRCYAVDKDTLDFLNPAQSPLPVTKVIDDEPLDLEADVDLSNMPKTTETPYGDRTPNVPERFDLPLVRTVQIDAAGKEIPATQRIVQYPRQGIVAIPIDCDSHSYLNPYTTYVMFNDTFPKDKTEQANLLNLYLTMKVVSRAYVMQQIGIENVQEMLDAVNADEDKEFEKQIQLNAAMNGLMPGGEEEEGLPEIEGSEDAE
jgi:hypothetical protein